MSRELFFDHLTIENGLSANFIKTTYIDKYGYVWIGTFDGVSRFDGKNVKNFNSYFKNGINSVNSIIEDESNTLWIGGDGGLYSWNRINAEFTNIAILNHQEVKITNIQYYKDNVLLVSSDVGFLSINTFTHEVEPLLFHRDADHPLNYSTGFVVEDDQVYISTKGGFVHYDLLLSRAFIYNSVFKEDNTPQSFVCIAKNNNDVYLATSSRGILRFSLENKLYEDVAVTKGTKVLSLACYQSKLFIGTDAQGLKIWDLESDVLDTFEQTENISTSLSSNTITSIHIDNNNILWIGTYVGGLNYAPLHTNNFNTYNTNGDELLNKSIRSIYFDENDYKFIGTRNGLYIVDDEGTVNRFKKGDSSLKAKIILKLFKYKDRVLVGTYEGGISSFSYKNNKLESWNEDKFRNESIYTIEQDKNGNLWIGGFKGIYNVSPEGEVKLFTKENSAFNDILAYSIKVDKHNRIWVGGNKGVSVYEYKNNTLHLMHQLDFGTSVRVIYFYLDSEDQMWVGTVKNGVYQFDMSFDIKKNLTQKKGLCNNAITSIIEGKKGEFWISTLNGLSLYNQKTDSYYNFYESPGIPGTTYCRGASVTDEEGNVWIGNEKGLVYFNHDIIQQEKQSHQILITDIFVGGKLLNEELPGIINQPVEDIEMLELKGEYNNIGFSFVDISNKFFGRENFLVKLEGKDDNWINIKNKNNVFYNSLKPGVYTFYVAISNETGAVIEDSIHSVSLLIKHQWHNSKVTLALTSIVLMILIAMLLYYSVIYRRKIKRQFENKSEEKERYGTSSLDNEDSKKLLNQIRHYTEESEAYLNSDLKIRAISEALDVSVHDISQSINQNLNQGFTDFINGYRIEECKKRLQDTKYEKFTMLAVAETCGFNSKSSFNRAFKKVTGQTPSEYLASIERA